MKNKIIYRIIQVVAILLALMYVQSFYGFVFNKEINFIHYTPQSNIEIWTVRNLGIRLLAIAVGLFIAVFSKSKRMLAMAFAIRLAADAGDLINSATMQGIAPMVWQILLVFVTIETICLIGLLNLLKKEKYEKQ